MIALPDLAMVVDKAQAYGVNVFTKDSSVFSMCLELSCEGCPLHSSSPDIPNIRNGCKRVHLHKLVNNPGTLKTLNKQYPELFI